MPEIQRVHSAVTLGVDLKRFELNSYNTNIFTTRSVIPPLNPSDPPEVVEGRTVNAQPPKHSTLSYLPFSVRWDLQRPDGSGITSVGMGANFHFRVPGVTDRSDFVSVAGSTNASGNYGVGIFSISREQRLPKDFSLIARAEGQWASQPLPSIDQFGVGGLAGVRGYREGEQYGDGGWKVSLESRSPFRSLDFVASEGRRPVSARGYVFVDYGEVYFADPRGRLEPVRMLGTGFGLTATLGSVIEARAAVAWALHDTRVTEVGDMRAYIGISAQF